MANYVYAATSLTGGGSGALDAINGDLLSDGDSSIVFDHINLIVYVYTLDEFSGLPESSPDIIAPDTNPGTKRWILIETGLGGSSWELVTSPTINAEAGDKLLADSTSVNIIYLPSSPDPMDSVQIADAKGTFSTNSVIVDPGTENIRGLNDTLELDIDWAKLEFIYIDSSIGWSFLTEFAQTGSSTLLELTDTPSSYDDGKVLASTASGTEWASISGGTFVNSSDGGLYIDSSTYDFCSESSNTWLTVGPTGSGGVEWAALDSVPTSASWAFITFISIGENGSASSELSLEAFARRYGSSISIGVGTTICNIYDYSDSSGNGKAGCVTCMPIPLNNRRFDLRYSGNFTTQYLFGVLSGHA